MRIQSLLTGLFRPIRSMPLQTRYRARFARAVGLSLLIHALVLSLRLGAPGDGLPGLALPWSERRVQAPGLTVRLMEVPRSTVTAPPPNDPLRLKLSTELTILPKPTMSARGEHPFDATLVQGKPAFPAPAKGESAATGGAAALRAERDALTSAPAASAPAADRKLPAQPLPPILTQRDPQHETFNVPPPSRVQSEPPRLPGIVAQTQSEEAVSSADPSEAARRQAEDARLKAEEAARQRAEEDARQRALALARELEARRLAEERAREAEDLAQKRALALQKEAEAKRLEEAKRIEEAQRAEEARRQAEVQKQEQEKRVALELEARKRSEELARQEAIARQKELEAKPQAEEAAARAREVAERQRMDAEAAAQRQRELAAQQPTGPGPRPLSGSELAAKALEQFRTPGAVVADPTRAPSPPPPPVAQRRRSIFGVEREVSLRMYVDSWRWKVERGGTVNYRPSAAWRARQNPIVTVSIRSDGSLEDVLINRSSGVREIDEAVLRIAQLHAPYSKFPPDIARHYDVIEIRRVWMFDARLRILDEM